MANLISPNLHAAQKMKTTVRMVATMCHIHNETCKVRVRSRKVKRSEMIYIRKMTS